MERPTAVSVFGFLNIANGALGILGFFWSIAFFSSAAANNPVLRIMLENANYRSWIKIMTPIGVVVSGFLLATGIGLLKLKGWARKGSIGYSIYAILFVVINLPLSFFLVYRPMVEQAQRMSGPESAGLIFGALAGTFGGVLGLVYPTLLWVFMARPKIVAAFQVPPPLPANIK